MAKVARPGVDNDEATLAKAAERGMDAALRFLSSPIDLEPAEWNRRRKAAKEGLEAVARKIRYEERKRSARRSTRSR